MSQYLSDVAPRASLRPEACIAGIIDVSTDDAYPSRRPLLVAMCWWYRGFVRGFFLQPRTLPQICLQTGHIPATAMARVRGEGTGREHPAWRGEPEWLCSRQTPRTQHNNNHVLCTATITDARRNSTSKTIQNKRVAWRPMRREPAIAGATRNTDRTHKKTGKNEHTVGDRAQNTGLVH